MVAVPMPAFRAGLAIETQQDDPRKTHMNERVKCRVPAIPAAHYPVIMWIVPMNTHVMDAPQTIYFALKIVVFQRSPNAGEGLHLNHMFPIPFRIGKP